MKIFSRKTAFLFITIAIPLIFFLLLEFALRIFGIGGREKLVLKIRENGKEFYQLNPNVGARYFLNTPRDMIPQLYPQKFAVDKPENTLRIFLLGGSTMAGFPYQLNARINHLLETFLQSYYPSRKFEVINFGLSAVNSFTVLDFSSEIMKYDPDLVIIYMGHNEFYGAFGVGSTEKIGSNASWIRFYLKLQKLRIFQLLRQMIAKISAGGQAENARDSQTLMENIAKKQAIALNSSEFEKACHYFAENLRMILKNITEKNCPIMVSTLVSNLRDQYPFISDFSPNLSEDEKLNWEKLFTEGEIAYQKGEFERALNQFLQCAKLDSSPAELKFMLGKTHLSLGKAFTAKGLFLQAKDADMLRFRAPEVFNEIIRKTAKEFQIPLIPLDSIFNANSDKGIVGYDLITEHLHPNIDGYLLMAKSFARAVGQIFSLEYDTTSFNLSTDDFKHKCAITIFDEAIGDVQIQRLTSRWPYRTIRRLINYENPEERNFIELIVREYLGNKISWNEAHYVVAEHFAGQNKIEKAAAEYLAVINVVPDNYFPYFKLGNLYFAKNNLKLARFWFSEALKRKNMPYIKAKLGMVLLSLKLPADAEDMFRDAVVQEKELNSLSANELALLNYYYAVALIQNGKEGLAKKRLNIALQADPTLKNAMQLLKLLNSGKRVKIQL